MKKQIEISNKKKEIAEKQIIEKIKSYDYDTVEYPVSVIVDDYINNEIYIPEYQRDFVWSKKRQAKFIESILLGIPIPYLFFSDVEGRSEIVDGSQRIRTLHAFLSNKLQLKELEKLTKLNGFFFKDLTIVRQRRFKKKSLKMISLNEKTDPVARFDLFERINTGSDVLKPMEVRKGLYSGSFYDFINECAENELFKKLCPLSDKRTWREEPQEMVLRFFAYSENLNKYNSKVRLFIDNYIKVKKKCFNSKIKAKMQKEFITMLNFVEKHFANGFAKSKNAISTPRVRFEAISIGVHFALIENPKLDKVNTDWLDSDDFKKCVTSDAANNKSKVIGRIDYVKKQLLGE